MGLLVYSQRCSLLSPYRPLLSALHTTASVFNKGTSDAPQMPLGLSAHHSWGAVKAPPPPPGFQALPLHCVFLFCSSNVHFLQGANAKVLWAPPPHHGSASSRKPVP